MSELRIDKHIYYSEMANVFLIDDILRDYIYTFGPFTMNDWTYEYLEELCKAHAWEKCYYIGKI